MELINYPCDLCGSEKYQVVFSGPDLLLELPGEFQLVKCLQCGLLRQNPRLLWNELADYYPSNFSSYCPQASEISKSTARLDKRYGLWKRVKIIHKYQPNGTWLDVGCGTGRILQESMRWGKWQLFGLEPVPEAAQYSRERLDIPIYNDTLESFQGHGNQYDIITMWDVLEHLPFPFQSIQKVNRLLKQGGLFVFSIPNLRSWDRALFKEHWIGFDLPRHLYTFSNQLITNGLIKSGFSVLEEKCVAGSHAALMLNISFLNKQLNSKLINRLLRKGNDYWFHRLVTSAPLWILDRLKLSTNITFVAQKTKDIKSGE